ncbi:MAG: hypothetical protein K2P98_06055 [Neisseriaceae bacterium]|nr:hypothetical protein [Neisseriaceae bacterium]
MKQFGISGNLTPFQPANPALDIPDGDPLELKKVTDQSMNAFYGEIASAIQNSGQTLTPVNGSNANPEQLWQAISANSFNGNLFIEAGGSTAQVRNLKCANPNTYLPTAIGNDPESPSTKAQWAGFCFTMENSKSAAYGVPVTINFKDKNGVTVMTTNYVEVQSPLRGGLSSEIYQDCVIEPVNYEVQPRFGYQPYNLIYNGVNQSVERISYRPEGSIIQIFRGVINTVTASNTNWNTFTFPVAFSNNPTIICQRFETNVESAGQVTSMSRAAFLTVSNPDVVGQGFKYVAFYQNGARAPDPAFYIFAFGYV